MTTTRTGRTIKPSLKVRENDDDVVVIKKEKPIKVEKPVIKEKPIKPAKVVDNSKNAPMMAILLPPDNNRSLNLVEEPSKTFNNPKLRADYGKLDYPYWTKYFYVPNDDISKRYEDIVVQFGELLPASFMEKIGDLEIKPEFVKPIKQTPLFSKLKDGDYEIETSKSDKNIASSINFFRKNLPSFQSFKDDDNISWVVNYHRILTVELLEYSFENKSSIATIKSKFNAITRILRIAFETKAYPLYEKYSCLVLFLRYYFEGGDWDNKLSAFEEKKYIDFKDVLDIQIKLRNQYYSLSSPYSTKAYDLNNDLLLLSLYCLIPPLRNEIKHLKFTTTSKTTGDWILFIDDEIYLDLNEEKKRHDAIQFNISQDSPDLARIIYDSYKYYPREFVFTIKNKYPSVDKQASESSLDVRLSNIFKQFLPNKNISVNSLRSSYVSYKNNEAVKKGTLLTVNEKEKIAKRMRTSRKYMDEAYLKIIPNETSVLLNDNPKITIKPEPVDTTSPYDKQLQRNKTYYDENKKKVLKQQKEYQSTKTPYDKSRVKMLHFLNTSPDYESKMKPATFDKYKFVKVNGKWT